MKKIILILSVLVIATTAQAVRNFTTESSPTAGKVGYKAIGSQEYIVKKDTAAASVTAVHISTNGISVLPSLPMQATAQYSLNAGTVDGQHASAFVSLTVPNTFTRTQTFNQGFYASTAAWAGVAIGTAAYASNVPAAGIRKGILPTTVIASSVAVRSIGTQQIQNAYITLPKTLSLTQGLSVGTTSQFNGYSNFSKSITGTQGIQVATATITTALSIGTNATKLDLLTIDRNAGNPDGGITFFNNNTSGYGASISFKCNFTSTPQVFAKIYGQESSGQRGMCVIQTSDSGGVLIDNITATGSGNVYNYANATTWNVTSDISFKENVRDLPFYLDRVMKLKPVIFDWQKNKKYSYLGNNDIGFVAQDVEKIMPEWVVTSDNVKSLTYKGVFPILIKCIQEQQTQIAILQSENLALTDEINNIKKRLDDAGIK